DQLGGKQTGSGELGNICPTGPGHCALGVGYRFVGNSIQYTDTNGDLVTDDEVFYGQPAYFHGKLYYPGPNDLMKVFSVVDSAGTHLMVRDTTVQTTVKWQYPGSTPSISSNGADSGIVWAIEREKPGPFMFPDPSHLHAYRADTLAELYNSRTTNED